MNAYLANIEPVDEWLGSLDLNQTWSSQKNLDPRAVAALLTCSDQLRQFRELEPEEVENLRLQVRTLIDDVLQADSLDSSLQRFLVEHLQAIRTALEEYALTGSYRLAETVRCAAGDFATDRPVPTEDKGRSLLERFKAICSTVILVTTAAGQLGLPPANLGDAYDALIKTAPAVTEYVPRELTSGSIQEIESGAQPVDAEHGDDPSDLGESPQH